MKIESLYTSFIAVQSIIQLVFPLEHVFFYGVNMINNLHCCKLCQLSNWCCRIGIFCILVAQFFDVPVVVDVHSSHKEVSFVDLGHEQ